MTNINTVFCRTILADVHKQVREYDDTINLRKDAWVWHFHGDHWEFHGPENYYIPVSAGNAYEARAQGWLAWLKSKGYNPES